MTDTEKLAETKVLVDDSRVSDEVITTYLGIATQRLLERMYPCKSDISGLELPSKHDHDVCELASRMIARRGVEGQKESTENGVRRGYATVDDEDILMRVTQVVGVIL